MLEIEKFRVGLSIEAKNIIVGDALTFGLAKKNGEANLNKFMNLFVERFCPFFAAKFSEFVAKVNEDGGDKKKTQKAIHDFFFQSSDNETFRPIPEAKKENLCYITFSLSEDNLSRLEVLLNEVGGTETYSLFFREFIYEYINYPSFARERILYSRLYNTIQKAIKTHKKIRYDINLSTNDISTPYSINFGSDRVKNYVVQYNTSVNSGALFNPISVNTLYKIRNLSIVDEAAETPSEEEKKKIETLIANGVEFYPQKGELPIKVEMSEEAIEVFNRKNPLRPRAVSIEGNVYSFDCTYRQFMVYFANFLEPFKVLEPESLKDKLRAFYEDKIKSLE